MRVAVVRRAPRRPPWVTARLADALDAGCHPRRLRRSSVLAMGPFGILAMTGPIPVEPGLSAVVPPAAAVDADVERLVIRLFQEEGQSLVRLVRLFVDDRNAAEDIVQEAFIRLARTAQRIKDLDKAAQYLRSIALNLARDHNRRGLVSLRHHLPFDPARASTEDEIVLRDDQYEVIEALRDLPHRQRDCLVLRYYEELGIDAIADLLGISRNSVKTHLSRGLGALESRLGTSARATVGAP